MSERKRAASSAPNRPHVRDQASLALKLQGMLVEILANVPDAKISPDDVGLDTDFSELGINSVDFLEFVITLEEELNIDVPDEALTDEAFSSVNAWSAYLYVRLREITDESEVRGGGSDAAPS